MQEVPTNIAVIVPFFNGNKYLGRLLNSINKVAKLIKKQANVEVIIVNDSPNIEIKLPDIVKCCFEVKIKINPHNMGIQKSRVNGLKFAESEWIIFLDQDDELVVDGFDRQIELTKEADIIVGNGLYQYGAKKIQIYKNLLSMKYLIDKKRFVHIRNMIPSPGECMIKKTAIPHAWIDNDLQINGADDWLLWILLFNDGRKFACNQKNVYMHNDSDGENLSLNIEKMYNSCNEMYFLLAKLKSSNVKELRAIRRAIDFKYFKDMNQLSFTKILGYLDVVIENIIYKLRLKFY
ncbi:glycosyltransferase family 2 protein [Loigolactobacillus backii]|uniref:glycosyltransferase family 2 protein n=1 Tax=Loigolactobacillus backii TaxID=375175 RepID=UPI0022FDA599|nr:glycosyltransferase family 2 protein [Loigolactobacillus backii]MDA5388285.1 glycosyltransferase [Loigolactobacillus backii]MDA5390779.1 glycosyltransferase [Loigolactobacillus backii]